MRIRREDVEHVREHTHIDEVVAEHVTLKPAGVGSMRGLCPFHDERTPSFHVRPAVGLWHCFGCGEGGDVIAFVQKVDHLDFADAVERLAARLGFTLRYEDDDGRTTSRREQVGQRQRLLEANRVAAAYFAEQLMTTAEAEPARAFLADRGFDRDAAELFSVGFAPRSGEATLRHLRGRGFTEEELVSSGLAGRGQRGLYDRFRGRLIWPIRDVTGDTVGFGARRLFEDDRIEAKYLNTPETALYHKSQVLYGVDLAKRDIARLRRVVVVEGYTDVMACHLAGITTALATCGTAFGADHIRIVRRLLGDDGTRGTEVVFTFDGDAAGQKAALRAFDEDQRFVAQTFVAVATDGMDPCDLRQRRGDEALRELVDSRKPLFAFAIRSTLAGRDLNTAEGRVAALRGAVPMVARIRDASLRPEYARLLAGWLGMEPEPVLRAVARAVRGANESTADGSAPGGVGGGRRPGSTGGQGNAPGQGSSGGRAAGLPGGGPLGDRAAGRGARSAALGAGGLAGDPGFASSPPDLRDPVVRVEYEVLRCLVQVPGLVPARDADTLDPAAFTVPAFRAVHDAVLGAGGPVAARELPAQAWAEAVRDAAPAPVAALVTQLAVEPLPTDGDSSLARYVETVVLRLVELQVTREIATLRSRVQRMEPDDPDALTAFAELTAAEGRRRAVRDRMTGI